MSIGNFGWNGDANGWNQVVAQADFSLHVGDANPHGTSVADLADGSLGEAYFSVRVKADGTGLEIALLNTNSLRTDANIAITQLAGGEVGNVPLGGATGAANSWGKITDTHVATGAAIDEAKLAHGSALEFLRTDATGLVVEWAGLTSADVLAPWGAVMNDPSGFPLPGAEGDTTLSVVDGTRTFTITPTGASFSFWVDGVQHTKTGPQSVVFPNTYGAHWIYFDTDGNLATSTSAGTPKALFRDGEGAAVAQVFWNPTTGTSLPILDERHGMRYPGAVHYQQHLTRGAAWISGGQLQNIVADGTGANATDAQYSVEALRFADEDLEHDTTTTAQVLSLPAQIPVLYLWGATGELRIKAADNFPFIYSGTAGYTGAAGRVPYNRWTGATWDLAECGQLSIVLVHVFGLGAATGKIFGLQGQAEYSTISAARAGAEVEINVAKAALSTLLAEAVPLGSLIIQTSTTYSNTPHARFRSDATGASYVDFRQKSLVGSASASTATTFADSTFEVYDETDNSKRWKLQLSSVGAGTTRTWTAPNVDLDFGAFPLTQLAAGGAGNVALGGATPAANAWGKVTTTHVTPGANNYVFRTSGAGAVEWGLLTTSNLATAAGVLPSQLSAGGANSVLQGAATAAAQTWTTTPTVASLTTTAQVVAGTYLQAGTSPASIGTLRFPATSTIRTRNTAGDGDVTHFETASAAGNTNIGPNTSMGGTTNLTVIRANGGNIVFQTEGTTRAFFSTTEYSPNTAGGISLGSSSKGWGDLWCQSIFPRTDNAYTLGDSTHRPTVLWAVSGTISTSDADEKTEPLPVDDALLDAWGDVRIVSFQWLDAVTAKGSDARIHHGVIAQQLRDALAAHGLDGTRYGLLCYDEWQDQLDADGLVVTPAGSRWGIRADQCLWVEAAWQRRALARLMRPWYAKLWAWMRGRP